MLKYTESDQAVIDQLMATLEELSEKYARWAQEYSEGDPLKAHRLYSMWMEGPQRYVVTIISTMIPVYYVYAAPISEGASVAK